MPTLRSIESILTDLRNFLLARAEGTDLSENAILQDICLRPAAIAGRLITGEIQKAVNLQIIDNLSGTDLENEGTYNYGSPRKFGRRATGYVTFSTSTEPTTDIIIPVGVVVTTKEFAGAGQNVIRFITKERKTIYYATRSNFFDPTTNTWQITLEVEAVTAGSDGNVPQGAINTMQTRLINIDSVTNSRATVGGSDAETDSEYRERLKKLITGRELGQRTGLENFVLSLSGVSFSDAYAISVNDDDSERVEGTDVFVIDNSLRQVSESFTFQKGIEDYQLTYRPVLNVASVLSQARGPLYSPGIYYEFIKDTDSSRRLSIRSLDKIRILPNAGLPNLDVITVTYNYAEDIAVAQNLLDSPTNDVMTADVLIKRATPYYVDIVASITIFENYDFISQESQVQSAVLSWLNTFKLGDELQQSDLIITMQLGYGDYPVNSVDQVIIRSIEATSDIAGTINLVNEHLQVPNIGYLRFGSITFV